MKRTKHRQNFLPAFLATILVWLIFLYFILAFAPESVLLLSAFYFLLFLANFLTFSLIFANSRRGFLAASATTAFLFLNQIKQAHVLNYLLLGGLLLSIELYFAKRH